MQHPGTKTMDLIREYAKKEQMVPDWAHDLLKETERDSSMRPNVRDQPPPNHPHGRDAQEEDCHLDETEPASKRPKSLPHKSPSGDTDESNDEGEDRSLPELEEPDRTPDSPLGCHVDRCEDDLQEEQGESEAVRKVFGAVQAIFGWEPLTDWHRPSPQLGVAWVSLMGKRVLLCLCGCRELKAHRERWPIEDYLMVSVQCANGSWAERPPDYYDAYMNLSEWSRFQKPGGGHEGLYDLREPGRVRIQGYRGLTKAFIFLWEKCLTEADGKSLPHICLVFFCKAGRHRSFALMIAFLMWASHVHDPALWEDLIAPNRNKQLRKGSPCQLLFQDAEMEKGHVPFGSVLTDYAKFLNREFPKHAWVD